MHDQTIVLVDLDPHRYIPEVAGPNGGDIDSMDYMWIKLSHWFLYSPIDVWTIIPCVEAANALSWNTVRHTPAFKHLGASYARCAQGHSRYVTSATLLRGFPDIKSVWCLVALANKTSLLPFVVFQSFGGHSLTLWRRKNLPATVRGEMHWG